MSDSSRDEHPDVASTDHGQSSSGRGQPPPPPTADHDTGGSQRSRHRIVRWRDDRVVAGVARGLAHWFGVDPAWVRLVFVLAAVWAGVGVLVYLALAVALPEVDHQDPATAGTRDTREFWLLAGGLFVVALATTFRGVPDFGVLVPVAAIALGVALWQRPGDDAGHASRGTDWHDPTRPATSSTSPAGHDPASAAAHPAVGRSGSSATGGAVTSTGAGDTTSGAGPVGDHATTGPGQPGGSVGAATATVDDEQASTWWEPPDPRPRPSWLGPLALGVALVTAAVQYALDLLDVIDVTLTQGLATSLGVLGVALLVGTLWGRAKWLAAPAAVLAAALFVSQSAGTVGIDLGTAAGVPIEARFTSADDVRMGVGRTELDLTTDQAWQDGPVAVEFGAGVLEVVVPWDADVDVSADVGVGALRVEDRGLGGRHHGSEFFTAGVLRLDEQFASPWTDEGQTLDLDVRLGAGVVVIEREPPGSDPTSPAPTEPASARTSDPTPPAGTEPAPADSREPNSTPTTEGN